MKKIFLLLTVFAVAGAHAQGDYQLTAFTSDYTELTGAEVWEQADWDDPAIEITLDFTFQFGAVEIGALEQIGLGSEWGTLSMDGANLISYGPDVIASQNATEPGAPSSISWITEGNPGNRILKIQYKDVAFYDEVVSLGTAVNRVNFQIWLYEQGGAFEFHFGPSNITDTNLAYYGLSGPPIYFGGDVNAETGDAGFGGAITGDVASPGLAGFTNFFEYFDGVFEGEGEALNGTPADGQVYRLSTTVVSTADMDQRAFELYPTIAQQEVFLRGNVAPGKTYRILNLNGAAVAAGILSNNRLDVSGLAAGMYLLQIDGTSSAQKFVKR